MIKRYVFLFFLLGLISSVWAQADVSDQRLDSNALHEAELIKDQQQNRIDSLIKAQLTKELQEAIGNTKKTQELEARLKEIAQSDSLRKVQQLESLASLKKTAQGYPVVLNLDTLWLVFTRTGSFKAEDRARSISTKIEKLYKDPFYNPDSLILFQNEDNVDIIYNQLEIIVSLDQLDGLWFGKEPKKLGEEYLQIIKETIQKERKANSLINLLKRIGLVLLIIAVLVFIITILSKLFKRITQFISLNKTKYVRILRIKKVKIFSAEQIENAFIKLVSVLKIITMVFVVYLSLPLLFSIFPETEALTGTLLDWILSPLQSAAKSIYDYLPNLFKVILIIFIFKYLIRAVRYIFHEVKSGNIQIKGFHPEWAFPTFNILRFVLYAFMLILVFPYLPGSDSPAFQGVSVFLGILISLGSSSAISNIIAGLVITYMRPFKIGDRVKIGEVVGDVMEKSMLVTRIKTVKNEDITVPNSMILSSSTVNFSSHTPSDKQGLIVHYTATIGYDVPWQKAYDLLIEAALKTVHVLNDPKPFVLQTSLDDYYISYQINAYTREANKQALIYSNLLENIQDVFAREGIAFLSPSYHVVKKDA
jgi:small-conductance mechanosensitive channel